MNNGSISMLDTANSWSLMACQSNTLTLGGKGICFCYSEGYSVTDKPTKADPQRSGFTIESFVTPDHWSRQAIYIS